MTVQLKLPDHAGLFYGGQWHQPTNNQTDTVINPATGEVLADIAVAEVSDVEAAIASARAGFEVWRDVAPRERGRILRQVAAIIRQYGPEMAMLDAADGGNPYGELLRDVENTASQFEYFAGLILEMKGNSAPPAPGVINFSVRQPLGVVARIVPFNHPFMFCAAKSAAPLAAGNAVIVKPPEQAPLSGLRLAELIGDLLPAGVFNVVPGGREVGELLSSHKDVDSVAFIGSVPTGKAVSRSAANSLKKVMLELGGKNPLIAFADADPDEVAAAMVAGMNFGWCGQSCGSTSRALLHEAIHDAVLERLDDHCRRFKPGLPTDPETTMGAIVNRQQFDRVKEYINSAHSEGARLIYGGGFPNAPQLADGFFVEPTVFADVTSDMRIAREEIFGPILSVMKWSDEAEMIRVANDTDYGLTCSIWTDDINKAHRTAQRIDAGFIWINEVGKHFLGTPYGGFKQSGSGREECLEELLFFTQEKHIHVRLK